MKKYIPGIDPLSGESGLLRRYGREYYGDAFIPVPGAAFTTPFGYPGEVSPFASDICPRIPSASSVNDAGTENELSERILADEDAKTQKKDSRRGI